eukprot:12348027-Karenia_brevis.AAC.1
MGGTGGVAGRGVLTACRRDYVRAMVLTTICHVADEKWQLDEVEGVLAQKWQRIWGITARAHEKYQALQNILR